MNGPLLLLALRRAASPATVAWWAALTILLVLRDRAAPGLELEAQSLGIDAGPLARGLLREGLWAGLGLGLLPLLVLRAARTVGAWREGEVDWLGSRATGRTEILASTLLGSWAAGGALLALSLVAVEWRAGASGPGFVPAGRLEVARETWIEGARPLAWTIADPRVPPRSLARVELGLGSGSGASASAVFTARRAGAERTGKARIAGRGAIEVEIPPGGGPLELALACSDPGARAFVFSDAAELWVPVASERSASLAILSRMLAALLAWNALALAAGAWVSAPIAFLLLASAWIPLWLADAPPAWMPGADLAGAIAIAGEGRAAASPPAASWVATAALAAAGVALARAGLRPWRRPA